MSVTALRSGIAANLATISGLRTSAFVPDNPAPPVAVVLPTSIDFDSAMGRGMDLYRFDVVVIANRASERSAQSTLDAYCNPTGSSSIKAAIESDKTLGGSAFDCRVTELTAYGPIQVGDVTFLAATFAVSVLTH